MKRGESIITTGEFLQKVAEKHKGPPKLWLDQGAKEEIIELLGWDVTAVNSCPTCKKLYTIMDFVYFENLKYGDMPEFVKVRCFCGSLLEHGISMQGPTWPPGLCLDVVGLYEPGAEEWQALKEGKQYKIQCNCYAPLWWKNGGEALFAPYCQEGFDDDDTIYLTEDEHKDFIQRAEKIDGWLEQPLLIENLNDYRQKREEPEE